MVTNHVTIRAYQRALYDACQPHGPFRCQDVLTWPEPKALILPSVKFCSQPKASKPRVVAILPSSWRATHRQVKTDERAQPFGAVGRSIECARYCSMRR